MPNYLAASTLHRARTADLRCSHCDHPFKKISHVMEVIQRMTNKDSKNYRCSECNDQLFNPNNTTLGLKPVMCVPCQKLTCVTCLQKLAAKLARGKR